MTYQAPAEDVLFVMDELAGLDNAAGLPGFEDAAADTTQAVLEENARFTGEAIASPNVEGNHNPSSWGDDIVTAITGFKGVFTQFGQDGWQNVQHPLEYSGQGLPRLIAMTCIEMLDAANLSFALCPLLTGGAIEALLIAGTEGQKQLFVSKLISGKWTDMMNLTGPQAGSGLTPVHTRVEPVSNGTLKIFGMKIFITWGERDTAENVVRLVSAHMPSAPEDVKGISLFVALKFIVNPGDSLDTYNDAYCMSIEHKFGIKASLTAVLQFDDNGGAIGTLVSGENRGPEYMFIMMDATRYAMGMWDIGVSRRVYQKVVTYARDRVQSRPVDSSVAKAMPIIHHPGVKRMLLTMCAMTGDTCALTYVAAAAYDAGHHPTDDATRKQNAVLYEFLMPIMKGWSTEMPIDVTSPSVQVHGGMGFIEEADAAQSYRDAHILPIYEDTTAIQINDLIGRKIVHDGGVVALGICAEIVEVGVALVAEGDIHCDATRARLAAGREALESIVRFVAGQTKMQPNVMFTGSVPYLWLCGIVLSG